MATKILFTLTMPGRNSWNGRWSGDGNVYARVRTFSAPKRHAETIKRILSQPNYTYDFGDGWVAQVAVREIKSDEAQKIMKKSVGFAGYEWFIESIVKYGKIMSDSKIKAS